MVEKFDIIYKGTSLKDCIEVRKYKDKKTLVVDDKKFYGNYKIIEKCIVEEFPQLIRKSDPLVNYLQEMNILQLIDFVVIKDHLYFNEEKEIKIPTSKNEISESSFLTNKDKFHLFNAIKNKNFEILNKVLSDEAFSILCISICGSNELKIDKIIRFLSDFDDYKLIYPIYGFKDICENISRCNAVNGISYLLEDGLTVTNTTEKCMVNSSYGILEGNSYICLMDKNIEKKYFTAINYKERFKCGLFYGVFDFNETIFCICLNSTTKACPKDTFLIYLWKKEGHVTDQEMKKIGIEEKEIIFSTKFVTEKQFSYDFVIDS